MAGGGDALDLEAAVGVEALLGFDLLRAEFDFGVRRGAVAQPDERAGDEQDEGALEHGRWLSCDGYRS